AMVTSSQPAHPGQAISGVTYSCSRPNIATIASVYANVARPARVDIAVHDIDTRIEPATSVARAQ
ncbi:hypothetical protein, partial [Mycobacterium sp. 1245111.1]|uniref:hypothetical protein n=1 Tax=Mycobacterium sp. 1245111.1 TaxID=1834073 RepID=UPI001E5D2ACC